MPDDTFTIDPRFQGIPDVALGGYVGGLLAGDAPSGEVALRRPVPLGRPLRIERSDDGTATLLEGAERLAQWRPGEVAIEVPPPVSFDEAVLAEARSLQRSPEHRQPFPNCLVCGADRAPGEGFRLFTGPVAGRDVVAVPWTPERVHAGPDGVVRPDLVWAVMDCPTIMALVFASPDDAPERVVTARLAVQRRGPVRAGEPHVIMAWSAGRDGKANITGGAVFSARGEVLAVGRHALVPVTWGVVLGRDSWRRAQSA